MFFILFYLQLFFKFETISTVLKALKIAVIINYFIIYLVFMLHGKILCTLSISEEKIAYIRNLNKIIKMIFLGLRIKIFSKENTHSSESIKWLGNLLEGRKKIMFVLNSWTGAD